MATTQTSRSNGDGTGSGGFFQQASRNRNVRLAILVVGAVYVTAMIYGSGMRRQVKTLQAVNEQRKTAVREYRLAQMDLRLRLACAEQLEARRQVGLAIQGGADAPKHIAEAVRLLTDAEDAKTSNADLSDVLADLQKGATTSADLTQIAARMDSALDKQVPGILQTGADWDKAHPIIPPTMNDVPQLPGNDVTNTGPQ